MNKKLIIGVVVIALIVLGVMTFQDKSKESKGNSNNTTQNESIQTDENNARKTEKVVAVDKKNFARANSAGEVDFEIVFTNPVKNHKEYWLFQMFTNTHSVDLDAIPFGELIHFIDDEGNRIDDGIEFSKKGSGHHLEQFIMLPKHIDGKDTILKEYEKMTLVIREVEGVPETTFTWNMTEYPEIFDH